MLTDLLCGSSRYLNFILLFSMSLPFTLLTERLLPPQLHRLLKLYKVVVQMTQGYSTERAKKTQEGGLG